MTVGEELIGQVLEVAKLERGTPSRPRAPEGRVPPSRGRTTAAQRACMDRLSGCGSCRPSLLRARPSMPRAASRSNRASRSRLRISPRGRRPADGDHEADTVLVHGSLCLLPRGRAVRAVPPRFVGRIMPVPAVDRLQVSVLRHAGFDACCAEASMPCRYRCRPICHVDADHASIRRARWISSRDAGALCGRSCKCEPIGSRKRSMAEFSQSLGASTGISEHLSYGGGGIRTHGRLHAQRFSRPPRSTAPAPRRGAL